MQQRVLNLAFSSRFRFIVLAIALSVVGVDYDRSTDIIFRAEESNPYYSPKMSPKGWMLQTFLNKLFLVPFYRWDSVYFLEIASRGYYYEQEFAFFPGLPLLMRLLADSILWPLDIFIGKAGRLMLAGVLISNISFCVAAYFLYKLTLDRSQNETFAWKTVQWFCLTPCGLFMSAIYTESLFCMLTFWGLYEYGRQRHVKAALIWGLGSLVRSNGIVYCGFFLFDAIHSKKESVFKEIKKWMTTLMACCIVCFGFIAFQYYGYQAFCQNNAREWCHYRIPLMYSFIQRHYWNNGFLNYFQVQQIPNFILASPMIALSVYGIWMYYQYHPRRFLLGWISISPPDTPSTPPFLKSILLPDIYLWTILLFYNCFFMHVQVILRFFSCVPCIYWAAAHVSIQDEKRASLRKWTLSSGMQMYALAYSIVGALLFSNFYPPA